MLANADEAGILEIEGENEFPLEKIDEEEISDKDEAIVKYPLDPDACKPYFVKSCWLLPSSIRPEFNKSASSLTDFIPSPGSVVLAFKLIVFALAKVTLKDEKPLIWASAIVKIADDWFPKELKFISLIVDGIVATDPSLIKEVANNGFVDDAKISSIFDGKFIFSVSTAPNKLKFTFPKLSELLLIKFLEAAAISSGFFKLNFIAPDLVEAGEIMNPSPSWGLPLIWTSKPSNWILFP